MPRPIRKTRRPTTDQAKEAEMIANAYDLAEQQLINGSASAQVITHFLKLGSSREALEQAKIEQENLLLRAKIEQIESQRRVEDLYYQALEAMKSYSGADSSEDYDDDFE